MNYAIYTNYKIKFGIFCLFFYIFENFRKIRKYFGIVGVFVKEIVIFNIGFGFCVLNSILKHRLKIFSDPQKSKKTTPNKSNIFPEVWTIYVRNIWGIFLGFWVPLKCTAVQRSRHRFDAYVLPHGGTKER